MRILVCLSTLLSTSIALHVPSRTVNIASNGLSDRHSHGLAHIKRASFERAVVPRAAATNLVNPATGLTPEWENKTEAACESSMEALNGNPGNPSGMAICYNLPYLDNSTGVFQADLRLFKLATPVEDWTGVTPAEVSLKLAYLGASVSSQMKLRRRDEQETMSEGWGLLQPRQSAVQMIQAFQFVGKINSNLFLPTMNA